jgi:small subunit ribosomal protein S1
MAETPQANEGDAEDKINPVAAPQETVAKGEAPAPDDASGAEVAGKDEGETSATESSPEADVAADQAPIPESKEPIAETGVAKGDEVAQEAPVEAAEDTAAEEPVEAPGETKDETVAKASAEDFAQMLDEDGSTEASAAVNTNDKIGGVIVKIEGDSSFVDYGGRGEAVIRTSELNDPKGELLFKVGDPLEAFVVSTGDEVQISRGLSRQDAQADVLYQAYKAGMPVEGQIDAVNKWGLGVTIEGDVRGFCPISQIDTKYVENAEEYRGQKMAFKIIEFRHQGRDIVVSRRALLEAEQDKAAGSVRDGIKKGAEFDGVVTRLESFGAFVTLGSGVEGLVHVSEISHNRVAHPQDVLKQGQEVKVQVLRTKDLGKRRKERISLSIKAMEKDPWQEIKKEFPVGKVVEGKVDGLEDFGAFVELAEGVRGMVHVSEIADRRIGHPREVLSIGEQAKVVVLDVDTRRQRLRLSIRQVDQLESAANLKEFRERQQEEQQETQSSNVMFDALQRAKLID